MGINTNMNAMRALNKSTKNTALAGKSIKKLSSGLRINQAGDDATGISISEKMRAQIRGLDQAERNTQDGISVVQIAEGATEGVGNILKRMRELSVRSRTETNSQEDRAKITDELNQLHKEIDRVASSTEFNGKNLLNGKDKIGERTIQKFTGGNVATGIQNVSYDSAFDLSKVGDISIKTKLGVTPYPGKVMIEGVSQSIYTVEVEGGVPTNGRIDGGKNIILTDKNGFQLTFQNKSLIAAGALFKVGSVSSVQEDIKGNLTNLQLGANIGKSQQLTVTLNALDTKSLGLTTEDINNMKADGEKGTRAAKNMIFNLDKALENINTIRANLGATQNRLEIAQSNLSTTSENLTAAESRIRDVDVAKEMMNLSKLNLLNQASQAMMSQAKSQPEGVMQLLR